MAKHWRLSLAFGVTTLSVWGSPVSAQSAATLSVDPIAQTAPTGTVVTVDVDIANVANLYGYQFDLTFNPSVLQAVSTTEGSFLSSGGSTFFIPGTNDNVGGTVAATADSLETAISGVSGSGALAVFTFNAIGSGTSAIGIQNEILLDSNLNVIADTTTGGSVTVTSAATKAPEINPASATTALAILLGGVMVMREGLRRRV
jgi:hypothetical protein